MNNSTSNKPESIYECRPRRSLNGWRNMELPKPPYVVNSNAPRKGLVPLQARNWPRWYCPRCQAKHYLEIDILMAVTRLECSSCHRKWNVLTTFTDANASARHKHSRLENAIARRSEDDIITDWDDNGTLAEDAQE